MNAHIYRMISLLLDVLNNPSLDCSLYLAIGKLHNEKSSWDFAIIMLENRKTQIYSEDRHLLGTKTKKILYWIIKITGYRAHSSSLIVTILPKNNTTILFTSKEKWKMSVLSFLWYTKNLNLGIKNITGPKQSGASPNSTLITFPQTADTDHHFQDDSLSKLDVNFNHKSETGFGTVFCLFILLSN